MSPTGGTRALLEHAPLLDWLREHGPQGQLLTSAGLLAGIDLGLRVVAHQHGEAVARTGARHKRYPHPEANARRV